MTEGIIVTDAKELKVGKFFVENGKPYKVLRMDVSKTGKHGHSKMKIEASCLFDGSRKTILTSGHESIEVPVVDKRNGQILAFVSEGVAQMMDLVSYETFDADIPEDLRAEIKEGMSVEYWNILGKKLVVRKRSD